MKRFSVRVIEGADKGATFAIPEQGAVLGRSRGVEIQLSDGALSRRHCRFFFLNQFLMVEDLGSSNGTTVNGVQIVGSVPLSVGDKVVPGESTLEVISDEEATASAPMPSVAQGTSNPPPSFVFSISPQTSTPAAVTPPSQTVATPPSKTVATPPLVAPNLFPAEESAPPATPVPEVVDLGLSEKPTAAKKRNLQGILLAGLALAVVVIGGIVAFTMASQPPPPPPKVAALPSWTTQPFEFHYERLEMAPTKLYRYIIDYTNDRMLSISMVDVAENRKYAEPPMQLSQEQHDELRKLLHDSDAANIPPILPSVGYTPLLTKRSLTLLFGDELWQREALNVEQLLFTELCNNLEDFVKSVANLGAIVYSREEALAQGHEHLEIARQYWEERSLDDGKLYESLRNYQLSEMYLTSLDPKPDFYIEVTRGLDQTTRALTEKYDELNFAIQKAEVTNDYEEMERLLQQVLRMIPNPEDYRYREASRKMLNVNRQSQKRRP